MAKDGRFPAGKSGSGPAGPGNRRGTGDTARTGTGPAGRGPTGTRQPTPTKGRQSVAAARPAPPGSHRTQLIIGGAAVVVIVVIIAIGLVLNRKQNAAPVTDYGSSTQSIATVAEGVVTVNNGTTPPVVIDLYQDAMCPSCQAFEQQYGQQINQAVDTGKLAVRYHMLNFLNESSASKDYSTRAAAALMCVAADAGSPKGTFMKYLQNLYADGTKPVEDGTADLSNQQLADLAVKNGATATASSCIIAKTYVAQANSAAAAGNAALTKATGRVTTPTVLKAGAPLDVNSTTWLSSIIS